MSMQTWQGPWGGMDMREGKHAPNSYFLGLNIDTSNGQLAHRPPLGLVRTGLPAFARAHHVRLSDGSNIALVIGATSVTDAPSNVLFAAVDVDNASVSFTTQDLTVAFGEPARNTVKCSFVDAVLVDAAFNPVKVVIVTTEYGTYVYDPSTDATVLRRAVVSTDAKKVNSLNVYYASAPMQAPIACSYQDCVYYAGFRQNQYLGLDGAIPAAVNGKWAIPPETYIGGDRSWIGVQPHVFMFSDPADPIAVAATSFGAVAPGERITGLHATSQALLIFTDKGIWAQTDPLSGVQKVVSGVGCVAHESIVTVGSVTYFAGYDGIYAFGGLGSPEATKISAQLDPLWAEPAAVASQLPENLRIWLCSIGYPWTIDARLLWTSVGRHVPGPNQIWWSVPVIGPTNSKANGFTLVYDVKGNAWNIYFIHPIGTLASASFKNPMSDAIQVEDRTFTFCANGAMRGLGRGLADGNATTDSSFPSICVIWCSHRFPEQDADELKLSGVWMRLKTKYVYTTSPTSGTTVGSGAVDLFSPMWSIEGAESAFDFENDLSTLVSDYDQRQTRTGAIQWHPYSASSSALGTGFVLGTSKLAPTDWFSSRAPCSMKSKSFRISIADMGFNRPPVFQCSSVSLELESTGTPRR